ncbi:MAG: hypothetical protein NT090_03585 [Acidobacteria bacterium]|nr:hypothetical protein [Acidobacteriota bacterium]
MAGTAQSPLLTPERTRQTMADDSMRLPGYLRVKTPDQVPSD